MTVVNCLGQIYDNKYLVGVNDTEHNFKNETFANIILNVRNLKVGKI